MQPEEINRRNEAIALFDGWVRTHDPLAGVCFVKDGQVRFAFAYHTDWNALMPVWVQIGRLPKYIDRREKKDECVFVSIIDIGADYCHLRVHRIDGKRESITSIYYEVGKNGVKELRDAVFLAISDYCLTLTAGALPA